MVSINFLPGVKQSFHQPQQYEPINSSNRRTLPSSCSLSARQQEGLARISHGVHHQRQASTSATSCFIRSRTRCPLSQSGRCTMWHYQAAKSAYNYGGKEQDHACRVVSPFLMLCSAVDTKRTGFVAIVLFRQLCLYI